MSNDAAPFRVLITGSASGIGRCFTEHYLRQPNTTVIVVDRNPMHLDSRSSSSNGTTIPNLHTHTVDLSSTSAIQSLVHNLAQQHPHLDLVIHSAGVRGLVPEVEARVPERVEAAETLDSMAAETMLRTFQINTLGTFTLLQGLVGCGLLHGAAAARPAKVVVMTSRMGSVSYNTAGGAYAYRASKAALNAVVKSLSIDVARIESERGGGGSAVFALVHPGRVETGLTKCREEGAIDVEESVADMLRVIGALAAEDSGRFMDRFGKDIGW